MTPVQTVLKSLDIEIKYRRENSLWNHILTVVRLDSDALSGVVTKDGFKVWVYSPWVRVFHPVIHGTIDLKSEKPKIKIMSKMNPLGQLLAVLILGLWIYGIFSGLLDQADISWSFLWKRTMLGLVMISIPLIAIGSALRYEYKKERERLKTMCQQWL